MSKKTLYHPNVADWSIEVDDDKAESYAAAGWRKTDPNKKTSAKSGEDNK